MPTAKTQIVNQIPLLSLILPAYNDSDLIEKNVPPLVSYLNSIGIDHEIIISDDGSRDGGRTAAVSNRLGFRYVRSDKNRGKGNALRLGMRHARGRFRIFTDSDIPFEHRAIAQFLWYLDFKEFSMVVGDRSLPQSHYVSQIPRSRKIGSSIFSFFVGRYFVGGWYDTQCGIKGFRAEVAEDLFSVSRINRFAIDVELLYIALKRNYDIKRLPVILRNQGRSHVKVFRDGFAMFRDLPRIFLNWIKGNYRPVTTITQSYDSFTRYYKQTLNVRRYEPDETIKISDSSVA